MEIIAEDIMKFHCPRWNELPEIDLYIDQVVCILQNSLFLFCKNDKTPIITPAMINNYVKQHALKRPIKKRYSRSHLAYLFVICTFKRVLSISEIREAIIITQKNYSVEDGYNLFCEELEKALRHTFSPNTEPNEDFTQTDIKELATLRSITGAVASSILVDRFMDMH